MKIPLSLGRDHAARKALPIMRVLGYFTAAIAGLTRHAVRGNAQHNPGEPLHWARGKSMDHAECVGRHSFDMMDLHAWLRRNVGHPQYEAVLTELECEYDARLWRAAADSQEFYETYRGAPVSPSSEVTPPVAPAPAAYDPSVFPQEQVDTLADDAIREITGQPPAPHIDRTTWPPVDEFSGQPNTLWVSADMQRWYATDDNGGTLTAAPAHTTESDARAAYWRWKDARPELCDIIGAT